MRYRHGSGGRDGIVSLSADSLWSVLSVHSDYTGGHTKLKKILLNGNNVAMVGTLLRCSVLHTVRLFANTSQLIPGGMPDQN